MKFSIKYDLADYINYLLTATVDDKVLKSKRHFILGLEIKLCKQMRTLDLPEDIKESCAVINLGYHSRELIKNSVDSVVKMVFQNRNDEHDSLLIIDIDIEYDKDHVTVTYADNGQGFDTIDAGELLNYSESGYSSMGRSTKLYDKTQLGGAGKGLMLMAKNMEMVNANLMLGNNKEGGAIIKFSSNLDDYTLPTSHHSYTNFNESSDYVPQLRLPQFAMNRNEKKISMSTLSQSTSLVNIGLFGGKNYCSSTEQSERKDRSLSI